MLTFNLLIIYIQDLCQPAYVESDQNLVCTGGRQVVNTYIIKLRQFVLTKIREIQGSKKTFFMLKPRACGLWKWTSPDFFQTSLKKIHFKSFISKQTPIGWVCYHLRTVILNPRRNEELIMGWIKCKQSTSFYALWCIKLPRVSRCAFFNFYVFIVTC